MCERASQCLHERPEFLTPGAKLTQHLDTLDDRIARLRQIGADRALLERTPALSKAADKTAIEAMRGRLADALTAFASEDNNIALAYRAGEYGKKTNFRTDNLLKANFKLLVEDARANAKSIEAFNITEADIAQAESMEASLPGTIHQTKMAQGQRKVKTSERDAIIRELRGFFSKKLDPTVRNIKDTAFAELYKNLRRQDQRSENTPTEQSGPGNPPVENRSASAAPSNDFGPTVQQNLDTLADPKPAQGQLHDPLAAS